MQNFTDITVLVDRSGSMQSIKGAMEEGFNAFITQHKETPSTRLTLVEFDNPGYQSNWSHATQAGSNLDLHVVYTARPISEVPPLQLIPRGGTPLLDALAKTIEATGVRLREMPAATRPAGVLFVIITDGEENASLQYTRKDVLTRIQHQEGAYQWSFVYLGANQDALHEAVSMGINPQTAITYAAKPGSTLNVWKGMTSNTAAYTASISRGVGTAQSAGNLNFDDNQRNNALVNETLTNIVPTP